MVRPNVNQRSVSHRHSASPEHALAAASRSNPLIPWEHTCLCGIASEPLHCCFSGATVKCGFADVPLRGLSVRKCRIAVYHQPMCYPGSNALQSLLPHKAESVQLSNRQQIEQSVRVRSWKIERFVHPDRATVFLIGNATRAVRNWRASSASDADRPPPRWVIRSFLETNICPTLLCSPNGHVWDARTATPCDLRQYANIAGLPTSVFAALQSAATKVTDGQMRSLLGQGVHGSVAALIFERCRNRLGSAVWQRLRSFASVGAGVMRTWPLIQEVCVDHVDGDVVSGIDTLGASFFASRKHIEYKWAAEVM